MLQLEQRFSRTPQFTDQPLEVNFIRHGLSAGNFVKKLVKEGKLSGEKLAQLLELLRIDWDIPLVPAGIKEAQEIGLRLKDDPFFDPKSIDVVVVANYRRARETGYEIINAAGIDPKKVIELNPTIAERDWGDHHLQEAEKILRAEKLRIEDPFCWSPTDGENMRFARERVHHVFGTFNRRFGGKRVLALSHGEFIVSAKSEICRIYDQVAFGQLIQQGIPNCGLVQFSRLSPEGVESKRYSHIRQLAVKSAAHQGDWSGAWQEIQHPKYDLSNIRAPATDRSKAILELLEEFL